MTSTSIRFAVSKIVERGLESLVKHLSDLNVIGDRINNLPYLSRWYLFGRRSDENRQVDTENGDYYPSAVERPWNLFLHHFHRGDDAGALHSHPWKWSLSLVLAGGYSEERRIGDSVERRLLLPFSFNVIRANDYHRIDLLGQGAWTLFLAGPHVEEDVWYFWDRDTKLRSRWDKYVAWLRGKAEDAAWEEEPRV